MIISIQSKWKIINPGRLTKAFMLCSQMECQGLLSWKYMNDDTLLVSGANVYVLGVDHLPTKSDLSLEFCFRNIVSYKGFG